MKKVFFIPLLAMMFLAACDSESKWESLFNGKDLTGWEFYLGVPPSFVDVPGMELNEDSVYTLPLGVNNDPLRVFSIVEIDGAPAIRISGEIFGSLATIKEYENYHLQLEVKWGDKIWQTDRWEGRRNSGLLYHSIGEFGKGLGVWKISHECQIMENDFGDSYRMGETFCDIKASRVENGRYFFDPAAKPVRFGHGEGLSPICSKKPNKEKPYHYEKPHGEWNTIELLCYEGTSVHVVNGKVNMINTNSHILVNGKEEPLTKGVIQLQSEGAEVYFRNIKIRQITKIPDKFLK